MSKFKIGDKVTINTPNNEEVHLKKGTVVAIECIDVGISIPGTRFCDKSPLWFITNNLIPGWDALTSKERAAIEYLRVTKTTPAGACITRDMLLEIVDRLAPKVEVPVKEEKVEPILDGKEVEIDGKKYILKLAPKKFQVGDNVIYSKIACTISGLCSDNTFNLVSGNGNKFYNVIPEHLEHAD